MRFSLVPFVALAFVAPMGEARAACSMALDTTLSSASRAPDRAGRPYAFLHAGSGSAIPGLTLAEMVATMPRLPRPPVLTRLARATLSGQDDPTGACLYRVEAVHDTAALMEIMESIAVWDVTVAIQRTFDGDALRLDTQGRGRTFSAVGLSLRGGVLRHRGDTITTTLGTVLAAAPAPRSADQP